jgi:hypothetical protein
MNNSVNVSIAFDNLPKIVGKIALALFILTMSLVICLAIANAYIIPQMVMASELLNQASWGRIQQLIGEIITILFLLIVAILTIKEINTFKKQKG